MLNIPAPELARTLDRTGRWLKKWEVRRRNDETWVDVSAYVVGDSIPIGTPDAPAMDFTVRFARLTGDENLAPGASESALNRDTEDLFRPLLPSRGYIRGYAANLVKTDPDSAAVWRLIAEGEIEVPEWPGNEVVCQCKTWDGVLERAWIEDKEERGSDVEAEQPELEDEMQALIERWPPDVRNDLQVLHTPVSPVHAVGLYAPEGSLGAQLRTMAQQTTGWDVRYLPDPDTGARELTLYEPPRDKTVPDLTLVGYEVERVPGLKEDPTHLRNVFKLTGQDADGRPFTVRRINLDSINGGPGYGDGYGYAFMGIEDPQTKTEAQGNAILAYADNDLSKPLAELRIRIPYCPWINTHDLIVIGPLAGRYDFETTWGVVGGTHDDEGPEKSTELELHGGGVVGQYHAWHARRGTLPGPRLDFYAIRVQRMDALSTDTHWAVQVESGAGVEEIWDAWLVQTDETDSGEAWDAVRDTVEYREDASPVTPYVAMVPKSPEGQVAYYRVEGRYVEPGTTRLVVDELRGAWQRPFYGSPAPLAASLIVEESPDGITFAPRVALETDPRGVAVAAQFYIRQPGEAEQGPFTHAFDDFVAEHGSEPSPPKGHFAEVRAVITRNDGGAPLNLPWRAVDSDKLANVRSVTWGDDGPVTTGVVVVDTDTAPGVGKLRMQVDGGAWSTFDVDLAGFGVTPAVTRSTTGTLPVVLQAMDYAGAWGPDFPTVVSKYEPPAPAPPALLDPQPSPSVFDSGSTNDWQVPWSVNASVNDIDHEIELTLYEGSTPGENKGPFAPSDGEWIGSSSDGDGVTSSHKVLVKLVRKADVVVIDARFTPTVMSAT